MLKSMFVKGVAALFVGLVAAVLPVRNADAAMFVGTFDPAFGATFPGLGFNGTATFQVPDSCLQFDGFCTAPGISLLSATVNLVDISATPGTGDQLFFGFASLDNVYILGGTLFGVNSPVLGPQSGVVSDGTVYSGSIYLQFELPDFGEFVGTPVAYIFACPRTNPQCAIGDAIQSNPATLTFVSEPSSVMLLLVALGAAAALRRRRT